MEEEASVSTTLFPMYPLSSSDNSEPIREVILHVQSVFVSASRLDFHVQNCVYDIKMTV